jgi:hypothetical protein
MVWSAVGAQYRALFDEVAAGGVAVAMPGRAAVADDELVAAVG